MTKQEINNNIKENIHQKQTDKDLLTIEDEPSLREESPVNYLDLIL
ncbi:hypothetical protein [Pedobacter nutrimenti]|nr:hypothetical protein [Pedobacter nutrimenti]